MKKPFEDQLNQQIFDHNNTGIPVLEGYSPNKLSFILFTPFEEESPIQINVLSKGDYEMVPMIKQIKYLGNMLSEKGEVKL